MGAPPFSIKPPPGLLADIDAEVDRLNHQPRTGPHQPRTTRNGWIVAALLAALPHGDRLTPRPEQTARRVDLPCYLVVVRRRYRRWEWEVAGAGVSGRTSYYRDIRRVVREAVNDELGHDAFELDIREHFDPCYTR